MFNFKKEYQTKNFTKDARNTCQYIILHHTAGGSLKGNLNTLLGETTRKVSAHILIDTNGDVYKLGEFRQVVWHAGTSRRGGLSNMNRYSIGIEIIGPDTKGKFSDKQYDAVIELIRYLKKEFHIPMVNILCHHDITRAGSYDKELRDGVSMCRKPDVNRNLWADRGFKTFKEFRKKKFLYD